jgi:hypothetical protein
MPLILLAFPEIALLFWKAETWTRRAMLTGAAGFASFAQAIHGTLGESR